MRGKASSAADDSKRVGITPAYAGKRVPVPHTHILDMGSPPPMRGKANLVWCTQCENRITPAYAGKSL